jgi:hypothetical protein
MLSEYPKESVDSVMKPLARDRPSSDTAYQGTVIIPYVKGTSEKCRPIRNSFNLRTRNADPSGTASFSELSSRLNIGSVGHS